MYIYIYIKQQYEKTFRNPSENIFVVYRVFALACAQVKLSVLLIYASINRCVYCAFEHSQH